MIGADIFNIKLTLGLLSDILSWSRGRVFLLHPLKTWVKKMIIEEIIYWWLGKWLIESNVQLHPIPTQTVLAFPVKCLFVLL